MRDCQCIIGYSFTRAPVYQHGANDARGNNLLWLDADAIVADARTWVRLLLERLSPRAWLRSLRSELWHSHDWVWVRTERRWACMRCGHTWPWLRRPPSPKRWPCPAVETQKRGPHGLRHGLRERTPGRRPRR